MFKEIYSFIVKVKKEIEQIEIQKQINAEGVEEEVEVKKKVKKDIPITIAIKKPNRKQIEEAETEFAIKMSECIKKGILTKAMLAKKYSDTGGALSEEDAKKLLSLYKDINNIEKDIAKMSMTVIDRKNPKTKKKISDFESELLEKRREIFEIENDYQTLFNHTADVKARNHVMMWYIVNLSFYKSKDLEVEDYKELFEGDSYEKKIESFYKKDEEGEEIYSLCCGKLSAIISYWYFSGGDITKDTLDDLMDEFSSDE